MTKVYGDCTRCGTDVTGETYGAILCDDSVGLARHDDVLFCENCRADFEDWLES